MKLKTKQFLIVLVLMAFNLMIIFIIDDCQVHYGEEIAAITIGCVLASCNFYLGTVWQRESDKMVIEE